MNVFGVYVITSGKNRIFKVQALIVSITAFIKCKFWVLYFFTPERAH